MRDWTTAPCTPVLPRSRALVQTLNCSTLPDFALERKACSAKPSVARTRAPASLRSQQRKPGLLLLLHERLPGQVVFFQENTLDQNPLRVRSGPALLAGV